MQLKKKLRGLEAVNHCDSKENENAQILKWEDNSPNWNNGWISIKDRFPPDDELVLVYIPAYPGHTIGRFCDGYFSDEVLRFDHDNKPTHWMPLPKPPHE